MSDYDKDARRSEKAWRRHEIAERTVLVVEPNDCHGEVIPGFCSLLLSMGYRVDVLMHHSLGSQFPLCRSGKEGIRVFTIMKTLWPCLSREEILNRYEAIIFTSSLFYTRPGMPSALDVTGLRSRRNLLIVEHELNDIERLKEEAFEQEGRLLTLGAFRQGTMVNPHSFGQVSITIRNPKPEFITVGALSAERKNHSLLLEALTDLYNAGFKDFSVTIVGEGETGEIPEHLRPFLNITGKLDFPSMFAVMERADYFLPLLDPANPAHERYISTGVTGSAQLIYGFAKIPLIHEKFASFYRFDAQNALLYDKEGLSNAMCRAIKQTSAEYAAMQQNLLNLGRQMDGQSRANLERALDGCRTSQGPTSKS
ncbi:hypothetical protein [Akkermansia muciniphila]|uniref:hypothetical protein n=1 Tax=Akkermansia muciniphila TaxID=239935 RepID=UPI0011AEDFC6|nr:hypothetical protein [Akkermansia muciniphila]